MKMHWGWIAGAATTMGALLGIYLSISGIYAQQTKARQEFSAQQAVMRDKIDDLESDNQWFKNKLWNLEEQCRH